MYISSIQGLSERFINQTTATVACLTFAVLAVLLQLRCLHPSLPSGCYQFLQEPRGDWKCPRHLGILTGLRDSRDGARRRPWPASTHTCRALQSAHFCLHVCVCVYTYALYLYICTPTFVLSRIMCRGCRKAQCSRDVVVLSESHDFCCREQRHLWQFYPSIFAHASQSNDSNSCVQKGGGVPKRPEPLTPEPGPQKAYFPVTPYSAADGSLEQCRSFKENGEGVSVRSWGHFRATQDCSA